MINILKHFFIIFVFNFLSGQEIISLDKKDFQAYGGKVFRVKSFHSKYVSERDVDVWVPENYNKLNKYSVIYMHDGGSLFGKKSSGFGAQWKADQVATKLLNENKVKEFIIVGIYNSGMTRWNEYYPEKSFNYLDKNFKDSLMIHHKNNGDYTNLIADDYLRFIVKELKPFIEKEFSVFSNVEETYIAGSSMGGLISMYAIFEYPEIFSRAACISTNFLGVRRNKNGVYDKRVPFSILDYMRDNVPNPKKHRIWFDYGDAKGDIDSYYVEYARFVDSIFNEKGYDYKNFKNIRFHGEKHNGISWNKRLDQIFEFLLKQ